MERAQTLKRCRAELCLAGRCGLLAPLGWREGETPFKASVEQTQVIEAALLGDVAYLGIRIAQEGHCFHHPQLKSQAGHRVTKMLTEQPAELTSAAVNARGQFVDGTIEELFR